MKLISVNELAQESKTTYHTVNFYINIGLLRVVDRQGNKRFLKKNIALATLEKVIALQKKGFPLRVIIKYMEGQIKINLN